MKYVAILETTYDGTYTGIAETATKAVTAVTSEYEEHVGDSADPEDITVYEVARESKSVEIGDVVIKWGDEK